jgi:hypothetical protein
MQHKWSMCTSSFYSHSLKVCEGGIVAGLLAWPNSSVQIWLWSTVAQDPARRPTVSTSKGPFCLHDHLHYS